MSPKEMGISRKVRAATGLRYVSDDEPGLRREKRGKSFVYVHSRGVIVRNDRVLKRIRSLAIPPAYRDVWICRESNGHLQATGRDARGRKQYRYHPQWRSWRDAAKFERMLEFSKSLPVLRRRVSADLRIEGLPRRKVIAAVVRLLERSLIRVGNEEYARSNHSYGLTTLKSNHVDIKGQQLRFRFRGKSGKFHQIQLEDRRLARIVRRCQDLPGQALFQFIDDAGDHVSIRSDDVNEYLREVLGADFSAKDFRTWAGTLLAAEALCEEGFAETESETKAHVANAIARVAERLGNTPSVCRSCYVHPAVISAYTEKTLNLSSSTTRSARGLSASERALQRLLKQQSR